MTKQTGGRPPTNIADRFRSSLWARRVKQCLGLSWTDLDNKYVMARGKWDEPYKRADYDVIRQMERICAEGRSPEHFESGRDGEVVNLVEAFVEWAPETKDAHDEFYCPIWKLLLEPKLPPDNDLKALRKAGYYLRGLVQLTPVDVMFGRDAAGKAFPDREGDLKAIEAGANLLAEEPILDDLMLLSLEYRSALDRLQPAEAQCYLNAFIAASERYTASIDDAYIGNGIGALIVLRLFRNDWREIGPEKWRRSTLKKVDPRDFSRWMTSGDKLWDLINHGPDVMAPVSSLQEPGYPIVPVDEKMAWFLDNRGLLLLAMHRNAMSDEWLSPVAQYPENWRELLETARTLWGEYEPVESLIDYGFQGRPFGV